MMPLLLPSLGGTARGSRREREGGGRGWAARRRRRATASRCGVLATTPTTALALLLPLPLVVARALVKVLAASRQVIGRLQAAVRKKGSRGAPAAHASRSRTGGRAKKKWRVSERFRIEVDVHRLQNSFAPLPVALSDSLGGSLFAPPPPPSVPPGRSLGHVRQMAGPTVKVEGEKRRMRSSLSSLLPDDLFLLSTSLSHSAPSPPPSDTLRFQQLNPQMTTPDCEKSAGWPNGAFRRPR